MINLDEDALICDFAETYHITDYTELPAIKAAILATGLREDSRIKMKAAGRLMPLDTILAAAAVDELKILIYQRSGQSAPSLITPLLVDRIGKDDSYGFDTGEDFDAAWAAG